MTWRPLLVLAAAASLAATASASEDEAWWRRAPVPASSAPLLALLVDTSEAMNVRLDVLPPYEPDRDYTAEGASACRRDRVYWRPGAGPPPDCGSAQWVSAEAASPAHGWQCAAGRAALESVGVFIAARAAQWQPRGAGGYWGALVAGQDGAVECLADRGRHGAVPGPWFAADGEGGPWQDRPDREPDWQAAPLSGAYLFYTGNYLAYLASAGRVESTRYEWLVRRLGEAARAVSKLDVAVARFSHDGLGGDEDARGGMLAMAPTPMPGGEPAVSGLLRSWAPAGPAPLGETLVEIARWLSGDAVAFGEASQLEPGTPFPSAAATRSGQDPGTYRTPFEHACRPVLTAIASAGQPGSDAGADEAFRDARVLGPAGCHDGCIARVAEILVADDLVQSLPGRQRTPMRWLLAEGAHPAVTDAARAARRQPLDLDDPGSLLAVMVEAIENDAAEPAGTRVSAAGLESRAHAAPDRAVYLAFSRPEAVRGWPGNLRRYQLAPASGPTGAAQILGRDGEAAFDAAGRLRPGSWSEWSATPDGADLLLGGAAAVLPDWDGRLVFSDLADAPLLDPQNRLAPGNPLLTRERLGLAPHDARDPAVLVEWLLGRDAFDEDFDGDRGESRQRLGDPGLGAPRVLRYAPDGPALAFLATEDGLLHAFDADTGVEQWAFAPATLLQQLAARSQERLRFDRPHGLGPVELLLRDTGHDGRIDASEGDQAWLFIGLGRGGTGYYGLDVSDPAAPRLLWRLDASDLPGFAESWPAPVVASVRLDPAIQGDDPRVLVLSGGHDPAEDASVAPASSLGAALALVAAGTGVVLWRAGGVHDPLADLQVPALHRSLPAAPRVLDTDGDGLDDRAYVVDATGLLLRFDFATDGAAGSVASARQVAALGIAAGGGPPRRFRVTPDAVLERRDGQDVIALAFGSGWTSRPRSSGDIDRFYVVFDPLHAAAAPAMLDESMLADVTGADAALPAGAPGWMYRLSAHGDGEKVTGQSLTFDHRVRFTTYQPLPPPADAPCGPPAGAARLYTLDIRDGSPVNRVGDRPVPDEEIDVEGLAPGLAVSFPPGPAVQGCATWTCRGAPTGWLGGRAVPLGYRNDPVRTSWRQLDAQAE